MPTEVNDSFWMPCLEDFIRQLLRFLSDRRPNDKIDAGSGIRESGITLEEHEDSRMKRDRRLESSSAGVTEDVRRQGRTVMAEVELSTQAEHETENDTRRGPGLSWDSSVEAVPLGRGWDAEACILDWNGTGRADLLVTSGGGSQGRACWLYRPAMAAEGGNPPRFDAGVRVPVLDGLRCVCSVPNDRSSRFDLVGLAAAGLVHLPNEGTDHEPAFETQEAAGTGGRPGSRRRTGRADDGHRLGPGWTRRPARGRP